MHRWELILAIRRLPQTQNNVVKYYVPPFAEADQPVIFLIAPTCDFVKSPPQSEKA
jgi:hypothetical protein